MITIPTLKSASDMPVDASAIYLIESIEELKAHAFSTQEYRYVERQLQDKKKVVELNAYTKWSFVVCITKEESGEAKAPTYRKIAARVMKKLQEEKVDEVYVMSQKPSLTEAQAFIEGMLLTAYKFEKYKQEKDRKPNTVESIVLAGDSFASLNKQELLGVSSGVFHTRNLVNEPVAAMNTEALTKETQELAEEAGFQVEVLGKSQIEALRMEGLLAVNKGSIDDPAFMVLSWKPEKAENPQPFIFVGKGVVYDTGGLSLKPTNYMESMKSDMAGAASVIGLFYAVAKANLPVHIMGLIPITDNRPGENAYAPDDVVTFRNGVNVEVVNTDAEGRMILADALLMAEKYEPRLVVDLATLTGSASAAVGQWATVAMGTAPQFVFDKLIESGFATHERVVQFPFWDDYKELLKSDIADIKNVGGREAGAITAGKFLEHFVSYPWMHLDIAGSAFLSKTEDYQGPGATGVGVRLLFDFLKESLRLA